MVPAEAVVSSENFEKELLEGVKYNDIVYKYDKLGAAHAAPKNSY